MFFVYIMGNRNWPLILSAMIEQPTEKMFAINVQPIGKKMLAINVQFTEKNVCYQCSTYWKKHLLSMFKPNEKKMLSMFNLLKKNVCYQCSTYWKKCLLSMFNLLKKNVGYQCSTYWKNCLLSMFNLMKKMFAINGKPAGEFSVDWTLIVIFFQWVAQC